MTAESLLHELHDPACYATAAPASQTAAPTAVKLIQTHLSVVCIADDLVYKLKKAIKLPFVDFSTLAARRKACLDEVRLNRRLCIDVYLGVAALRRTATGLRFDAPSLALDNLTETNCIRGAGQPFDADPDARADDSADAQPDELLDDVLDYAVVMRRLPQQRMLDELLATGDVDAGQLHELARLIVHFHARAERSADVRRLGDPQRLAGFAADNFTELAAVPKQPVAPVLLTRLAAHSVAAFQLRMPTLQRRAAAGRIVDGHGDLHARNICMTSPPTVYDCIEFEPAFRCGDVATEIAFLAMDLRYRHAPQLARAFVDAYVQASGDRELPGLLPLLCSYRAMVRAKVAAMAAAAPELSENERDGARRSCLQHTRLAAAELLECDTAQWLVVFGPPASGKSQLCHALAEQLQWPSLSTDLVRKQLAGITPSETAAPANYTPQFSAQTYFTLLQQATQRTAGGARVVVLDGNFPTPAHRAEARAAARLAGARVSFVMVHVDQATAEARATARAATGTDASDADAQVTAALHQRFVLPTMLPIDIEAAPLCQLDGATATEALVDDLLAWLLRDSA